MRVLLVRDRLAREHDIRVLARDRLVRERGIRVPRKQVREHGKRVLRRLVLVHGIRVPRKRVLAPYRQVQVRGRLVRVLRNCHDGLKLGFCTRDG